MTEGEETKSKTTPNETPRLGVKDVGPTPSVVLVDVANVAYGRQGRGEAPKLEHVLAVLDELQTRGSKVVAIADAALRHRIDRKAEFEALIDEGRMQQVPAGTAADDLIWSFAQKYAARGSKVHILTNDRFPFEKARAEGVEPFGRIAFMFLDGEVVFQPSLATALPSRNDLGEPKTADTAISTLSTAGTVTDRTQSEPDASDPRDRTVSNRTGAIQLLGAAGVTDQRLGPIPLELLDHLSKYFRGRGTAGSPTGPVNFASVAHFLHSTYGGDFCPRFGYKKPKDLALALEREGYVRLSHHTTTLYVEPTEKFVARAPVTEG
jgi:hypothetical protein